MTMTALTRPTGPPRPDIQRAFAHLAPREPEPGAGPEAQLAAARAFVDRYGDVEPRQALHRVKVTAVRVGDCQAEWLVPPNGRDGDRLVYLHGGGWFAGGLESHRPMAATLAETTGCATLLVAYRLAPENPFPAGLDDCVAALDWTSDNGPEGQSPATALFLAGDSAGANLAAAACLLALGRGQRAPDRLAMICAPVDGSANPLRGSRPDIVAGNGALEQAMIGYVQGRAPLDDPRVSPLHADAELLAGFPPTLLQASSAEFLLWDSRAFADRLIEAGVRTNLSIWPDMPHVWHAFLELLPESRLALAEIAAFFDAGRTSPA